MPHQCVSCGEIYGNTSDAILEGCTECGAKLFFFIRDSKVEEALKKQKNLSEEDKDQIEAEVDLLIEDRDEAKPVVLDIETVNILAPGQYEIDLIKLFEKQPLIYKMEEGRYVIDVHTNMNDN